MAVHAADIEACVPTVRAIASQYGRRCPPHVELDDLVQDGYVGLMQAATRYQDGHGATFKTFAWRRASGAILDGLRATDVLSRRKRMTHTAEGGGHLIQQWGPREADARSTEPDVDAVTVAWLRRRLSALPARERYILTAYYFGGQLESEIAARLKVSHTGVNYLRRQALKRMAT